MPQITRPQVYRVVRAGALWAVPRERWTRAQLLAWLLDTQRRNDRARLSHARRRAARNLTHTHPAAPARAA